MNGLELPRLPSFHCILILLSLYIYLFRGKSNMNWQAPFQHRKWYLNQHRCCFQMHIYRLSSIYNFEIAVVCVCKYLLHCRYLLHLYIDFMFSNCRLIYIHAHKCNETGQVKVPLKARHYFRIRSMTGCFHRTMLKDVSLCKIFQQIEWQDTCCEW